MAEKTTLLDITANERLQQLIHQFTNPELCYRELIQNARDAETDRIDITFDYDPMKKQLQIAVEDYGEGMDHHDMNEFLFKLDRSSKEGNLDKAGRFGIGFTSVFRLKPDEIHIESCKNGEHWHRMIDEQFQRWKLESTGREGTKVTIVKKDISEAECLEMQEKAMEGIKSCRYVEIPMYFCGLHDDDPVEMNQTMDLDSLVKVYFDEEWGEGVVTLLPPEKDPYHVLMNNRLVVVENDEPLFDDERWSVMVSSRYIKTVESRNAVQTDMPEYKMVLDNLKGLKRKIESQVFYVLEEIVKENGFVPGSHEWVMDYAYAYLRRWAEKLAQKKIKKKDIRKMLPASLQCKIFPSTSGNPLSLLDILTQKKETKALYYSSESNRITRKLEEDGKQIVLVHKFGKIYDFLCKFGSMMDVNDRYAMPKVYASGELDFMQKCYLNVINEALKHTSLGDTYSEFHLGNFNDQPKVIRDKRYLDRSESLLSLGKQSFWDDFKGKRRTLLNLDDEYVAGLVKLSITQPVLAAYYTLEMISDGLNVMGEKLFKEALFKEAVDWGVSSGRY